MKPYAEATTRERLEAVARVTGLIEAAYSDENGGHIRGTFYSDGEWCESFSPHDDDGDNRRLQVAMGADLLAYSSGEWRAQICKGDSELFGSSNYHENPNDAVMELAWLVDQANQRTT